MIKYLITGGAGFIGSNLADILSDSENEVTIYDNLTTGYIDNIPNKSNIRFIQGDIRDSIKIKELFNNTNFDTVFHLAAEVSVPASMKNPIDTEHINTIGTLNILDLSVKTGVKSFFLASSAAIYGDSILCPKRIDMAPSPISPYAISKLSGEFYAGMFYREYGIKTTVARFFNVFGEKQDPKSAYAAAVPIFISKALNNETITIYGDGEQTRDFIYVKDLCKFIISLTGNHTGIFNLGYGQPTTINSLVKTIINLTNSKSKVEFKENRIGDVKYSYADTSQTKITESTKIIGFNDGLLNTINYFKKMNQT